ncbi:MAG: hypothetical protein VX821_06900, partial [Verrucomicrobiota bacterium]|nr:hypothetical protein [Verrucomicrobiota bacterium]
PQRIPAQVLRTRLAAFKHALCDEKLAQLPGGCRLKRKCKLTKATFPTENPDFDPAKREARWNDLRTNRKERLEKQHAEFVRPDYRPNQDWWGSSPTD